jgi:hypothetical protein
MGIFKDEYGDDRVVEEIALGKKLYRLRRMSHKEVVKGKGMPNGELKAQFSSADYLNALYHAEAKQASFNRMLRKDLVLQHTTVTKYAIATLNEAVFLLSPHASRPLGHYRNAEERTALLGWEPLVEVPSGLRQAPHKAVEDTMMLVDEPCREPAEAAVEALETAADEPTEPDDGNSDVSFDDDGGDFEELSD